MSDVATADVGARRVLVAVFGATDIEPAGDPMPLLERQPGPFGHPQIQLRAWARKVRAALAEHPLGSLTAALHLPKIEPVLSALSADARALEVVLVASAQDDERFRPGDTEEAGDVLVELVPGIAARYRLTVDSSDVRVLTLEGNPTDPRTMWEQAAKLVGAVLDGERREVHLTLMGGTPAMGTAVATRFWHAAERGLATVRAWRIEDGAAVADEAVGIAARASITTRLAELVRRWRFEDVATLAESSEQLPQSATDPLGALARAGAHLLDLNLRVEIPPQASWLEHHRAPLQFPETPETQPRGALADFRPLACAMLAALRVREQREEPLMMLSLLHLLAEYLPVLAWQPVLGHAADPAALHSHVEGPESRWGVSGSECAHAEQVRTTVARVLNDIRHQPQRWESTLRRDYSVVADALRTCGLRRGVSGPAIKTQTNGCSKPCSVITQLDDRTVADLHTRLSMATRLSNGEVMALRHAAPVGHFFGTPTVAELRTAWRDTARKINDVDQPAPAISLDEGDVASQVSQLTSLVAGSSVEPSAIFDQVRDELLDQVAAL